MTGCDSGDEQDKGSGSGQPSYYTGPGSRVSLYHTRESIMSIAASVQSKSLLPGWLLRPLRALGLASRPRTFLDKLND